MNKNLEEKCLITYSLTKIKKSSYLKKIIYYSFWDSGVQNSDDGDDNYRLNDSLLDQ